MTQFEGTFAGKGIKVGIVIARFNEFITAKLLSGAKDNLLRHGVKEEDIDVYWVPGAVIRGATTHYELVSNEVAKGVAQIGLNSDIPVMFGVLTTETIEQAIERAGTKAGNKGSETAQGLIEMISLNRLI